MPEHSFKKIILRLIVFVCFIAVLVLLDQWTKSLAVKYLRNSEPFVLIPGVLEFTYLENTGAAFGTMKGMRTFFLIFAPAFSAVLLYLSCRYYSNKKLRPLVLCFLFVIAGAVGNFIDRLRLGYVVDFIYFRLIDFPVFNTADIYVTCASIIMMLLILFRYKDEDFGRSAHISRNTENET